MVNKGEIYEKKTVRRMNSSTDIPEKKEDNEEGNVLNTRTWDEQTVSQINDKAAQKGTKK